MKAKTNQKSYIAASVAFATLLAMWLLYYFGSKSSGYVELFIFGVGIMLFLTTFIPAIFVKLYERGSLSDLGIHAHKIKTLFSISVFLGIGSLFYYFQISSEANISVNHTIQLLIWNMLMLWEILFVYGWLQIRYEKAFGAVPAILMTGLSFAVYHIGTVPAGQVLALVVVGVFGAILFKLSGKSIFVLWPFFWGVGSAISAVQSHADISISPLQVITTFALLVIQVLFLAYWFKRQQN